MSNCVKCGGDCKGKILGGEDGVLIYKYYAENDTVEHYARYDLCCEECSECGGLSSPKVRDMCTRSAPNAADGLSEIWQEWAVREIS